MTFSLLCIASLVALSSAWQNCDRAEIQTATTNGADYTRITDIDFENKESVAVFSVKACKDARLRMTEQLADTSRGLNINIDVLSSGKPMTYVNFRTGNSGKKWTRILEFNVGAQLDCKEYHDFWVSWDIKTRTVAIGKGRNPNEEAYGSTIVPESKAANLKYLHISSNRQNEAKWKLYKQCNSNEGVDSCGSADTACNTCKGELLTTVQNPVDDYVTVFDLIDMVNKEPSVVVGVKSCTGIRMRFLEEKDIEGMGYNVNIDIQNRRDGPDDFHAIINYRTGNTDTPYVKTRDILTAPKLSCTEYDYFWVTWDYGTGRLSVGEGRDPTHGEFLYTMMTGSRKREIRYLALYSQAPTKGSFKVYEQCDLPNVAPSCEESLDCEENFRCVGGSCEECPEGSKVYDDNCHEVCLHDEDCTGNSVCNVGVSVCVECPAGTAPRIGSCDETCSAGDTCSEDNHACVEGFCTPCLVNEIVQDASCVSVCVLKKNEGTCSTKKYKWFYKESAKICLEMNGCDEDVGNSNSFPSKTACIDVCSPKTIPPECLLETEAGICEDIQKRYHYSPQDLACKKFTYNGCEGNENNFSSKEACRLHCAKYD